MSKYTCNNLKIFPKHRLYINLFLVVWINWSWHFFGKNGNSSFSCKSWNFLWYFVLLIKVRNNYFQYSQTRDGLLKIAKYTKYTKFFCILWCLNSAREGQISNFTTCKIVNFLLFLPTTVASQLGITCLKLTIETLEQSVKYI